MAVSFQWQFNSSVMRSQNDDNVMPWLTNISPPYIPLLLRIPQATLYWLFIPLLLWKRPSCLLSREQALHHSLQPICQIKRCLGIMKAAVPSSRTWAFCDAVSCPRGSNKSRAPPLGPRTRLLPSIASCIKSDWNAFKSGDNTLAEPRGKSASTRDKSQPDSYYIGCFISTGLSWALALSV